MKKFLLLLFMLGMILSWSVQIEGGDEAELGHPAVFYREG